MSMAILIVDYVPSASQKAASTQDWRSNAEHINALDGLHWKYWLRSVDSDARGGVYLFSTMKQAEVGFGHLEKSLTEAGASAITHRLFEVDAELSAVTRGVL